MIIELQILIIVLIIYVSIERKQHSKLEEEIEDIKKQLWEANSVEFAIREKDAKEILRRMKNHKWNTEE